MKVHDTGLEGLYLVEPKCFGDARGFFLETYQEARYRDAGMDFGFVQDNQSRSSAGVLRGMHFQVQRPQAQMVTVLRGSLFDVAVDLRPRSRTFGKWFGAVLSDDRGPRQICMAPGFAHGYYVLSDICDLHYKVSRNYDAPDEGGLLWDDPDVGISWPEGARQLSPRDAAYPRLRALTPAMLPHDPPIEVANA
jgi:dTDP-4-dehydrorhamnose 3,5-epimerase